MAQPPEPIDPNFRIELPDFEGPLDLLLHLISKHELDILDLPVAFVTERYLAYLGIMRTLDLDVAAEYLLMAAKLAHIKSKLLLPSVPDDQDELEEDERDPREELIRRLLEYQKYKLAAEDLGARGVAGRDVFMRGIPGPRAEGLAPLAEVGLFKLLDAFQAVLSRANQELAFEITADRISIQERMTQIVERLRGQRVCTFDELFDGVVTRYDIVVTFMAVLEMAKMRMMRVYQPEIGAPLHLEHRVLAVEEGEPDDRQEGVGGGAQDAEVGAEGGAPAPRTGGPTSEPAAADTPDPPPARPEATPGEAGARLDLDAQGGHTSRVLGEPFAVGGCPEQDEPEA